MDERISQIFAIAKPRRRRPHAATSETLDPNRNQSDSNVKESIQTTKINDDIASANDKDDTNGSVNAGPGTGASVGSSTGASAGVSAGANVHKVVDVDTRNRTKQKRKRDKDATTLKNGTDDTDKDDRQKALRTIFVGNVPKSVMLSKADTALFKRHISQKGGKIDSIRFRSIALSEQLPRKVAFMGKKFHESRDSVNAYVVFANENQARTCLELNGSVFIDHHLRVDSVAHPAQHDQKRSVFIGNLAFDAQDEPLWRHFSHCGAIDFVRVVRDSATNVGKGFAYVQFKDQGGVVNALQLNNKPCTGSGRPLRVVRAKRSSNERLKNDIKRKFKGKVTKREFDTMGKAAAIQKAKRALEGHRATVEEAVPPRKKSKPGHSRNRGK